MARNWWEQKHTRRSISGLTALLATCGGMEKPVVEVRLEITKGTRLRALLVNHGTKAIAVLHSANLQPSKLILKDAAGREAKGFDNRIRAKFDRTVRAAMFKRVPAGGTMELDWGQFRKSDDGNFELQWGPFLFGDLGPGAWEATAVFEATIGKADEGGAVADAWTGKAVSAPVRVTL